MRRKPPLAFARGFGNHFNLVLAGAYDAILRWRPDRGQRMDVSLMNLETQHLSHHRDGAAHRRARRQRLQHHYTGTAALAALSTTFGVRQPVTNSDAPPAARKTINKLAQGPGGAVVGILLPRKELSEVIAVLPASRSPMSGKSVDRQLRMS